MPRLTKLVVRDVLHNRHVGCRSMSLLMVFSSTTRPPDREDYRRDIRPLNQSVQVGSLSWPIGNIFLTPRAGRERQPSPTCLVSREPGVQNRPHPNRKPEIILPPITSRNSRAPTLSPAAPATTISGKRCSSRGWHWRADGALSQC